MGGPALLQLLCAPLLLAATSGLNTSDIAEYSVISENATELFSDVETAVEYLGPERSAGDSERLGEDPASVVGDADEDDTAAAQDEDESFAPVDAGRRKGEFKQATDLCNLHNAMTENVKTAENKTKASN